MTHNLNWQEVGENKNLVSSSILEAYNNLANKNILVAEIDPAFMNGIQFCEHYGVLPETGANCVIVEASRGETRYHVAVVVPVGYRADLNGIVRKHLDAKKVSFANLEKVIEETGMEYGSITPFGLPNTYRILVDKKILDQEDLIIGGGKQISKIKVPTTIFKDLPNTEIIENLGVLPQK